MSELTPRPPRKEWQGPDGQDRRRPSSVETDYKGKERRKNPQPMFEDPAGNTDLPKPGASEADAP